MIQVDAAPGGQVFRTAIGLASLTGKEIEIVNIRSDRPNPGLRAQHLTALETVAGMCNATINGASKGSGTVNFLPGKLKETALKVNIGTAGSATLLLQSAMFPSLKTETKLRVTGGTDVEWSPPFAYMGLVLLPILNSIGCNFSAELIKRGYYPKGKGIISFKSSPAKLPLKPLNITEKGDIEIIKIFSHCASLATDVARNQMIAAKKELRNLNVDFSECVAAKENIDTIGSGIDLFAHLSSGQIIGANALGKKGFPANEVGKKAAKNLLSELGKERPVDKHLADQLIPFMALAKGNSEITCTEITAHTENNISVCEKILGVKFSIEKEEGIISVEGMAFK
ncbi:MAG: RNA 3'-terminal phosphate cyclase [Candidatus Diapherotrites archaeon]